MNRNLNQRLQFMHRKNIQLNLGHKLNVVFFSWIEITYIPVVVSINRLQVLPWINYGHKIDGPNFTLYRYLCNAKKYVDDDRLF